jgi:hypothetical protein
VVRGFDTEDDDLEVLGYSQFCSDISGFFGFVISLARSFRNAINVAELSENRKLFK